MYNMKRKNNGVTLIALIITIIVLLILAAVSFNVLLGNNGLLSRARDAGDIWVNAEANETESLNKAVDEMDKWINEIGGGIDTEQGIEKGWQAGTPNKPVIAAGMVPIKWNGTLWVATTESDPEWYNYIENKTENETTSDTTEGQECRKWANVMLKDSTKVGATYTAGETYTDTELRKHVSMDTKI